jgi:Tol biopolymer transport system component
VGSPTIIKLTSGDHPVWSPDGERIAFASLRSGTGEIYVMKRDGTDLTQLSHRGGEWGISYLAWSPDGSRIVYAPGEGGLEVVNSDGSNPVTLVVASSRLALGYGEYPTWAPDGQRILFTGYSCGTTACVGTSYVIDRDGSKMIPLAGSGSLVSEPSWSPDGSRIAFISIGNGTVCYGAPCGVIHVMNADGSGVKQLTSGGRYVELPYAHAWSPDGSTIAFISYSDWMGPSTYLTEVMQADGTNRRRLADGYVDEATWSPDSRSLLGTTYDPTSREYGSMYRATLVVFPLNGATPQPIVDGHHGDWSPDGKWIVFANPH